MAHKKSGGRAKNGRDSNPKYLGIKYFEGEFVKPGTIIVRQKGTKIVPGLNTLLARDYSILATIEGVVKFEDFRGKKE